MRCTEELVERLLGSHKGRRHPRTQVELPVEVLCIRHSGDTSDPAYLPAVMHDVSASGALISAREEICGDRVWLKLMELESPVYLEAELVRRVDPQIPMAHSYGVRFSRVFNDFDFTKWTRRCRPRRTSPQQVLFVATGDVIDLESDWRDVREHAR